jgi:glycosyltransferase involved in cell wall biosynthesis
VVSVQQPTEVRVFHREARTLKSFGYDVKIVAQCEDSFVLEGIKIIGIGKPRNRFQRFIRTTKLFLEALRQQADVYHIHNPELLVWGVILRILVKKPVIYDVHESFPDAVLLRDWIPRRLRKVISMLLGFYEKLLSSKIDYVIAADPSIAQYFFTRAHKVTVLYNYPVPEYFPEYSKGPFEPVLVHAGSLSEDRGMSTLIKAMKLLAKRIPTIKLIIVGSIDSPAGQHFLKQAILEKIEDNVLFTGRVDHKMVPSILTGAEIGLSLLEDVPKYHKNIPQKVFEYLAAGLPVVATDLPPLQSYANEIRAIRLVQPGNAEEVAAAVEELLNNPDISRRLGREGRNLVLQKYSWDHEVQKLKEIYTKVMVSKYIE